MLLLDHELDVLVLEHAGVRARQLQVSQLLLNLDVALHSHHGPLKLLLGLLGSLDFLLVRCLFQLSVPLSAEVLEHGRLARAELHPCPLLGSLKGFLLGLLGPDLVQPLSHQLLCLVEQAWVLSSDEADRRVRDVDLLHRFWLKLLQEAVEVGHPLLVEKAAREADLAGQRILGRR